MTNSIQEIFDKVYGKKRKRGSKLCQFPMCPLQWRHRHHVTYSPDVVTKLCKAHHRAITIINCNESERLRHKLSHRERMMAWLGWIEGTIQPIETPQAMNWVRKWH